MARRAMLEVNAATLALSGVVQTRREIDRERFVLKYLRGDFEELSLERAREAPGELLAAAARSGANASPARFQS